MGNGHWGRPVYRGPSKGAARHTPFLHLRTRGARAEKDLRNQPGIGKGGSTLAKVTEYAGEK